MFLKILGLASALALTACQSANKKNLELVQDRARKLIPISSWSPLLCEVEVTPSQPAIARYKEMFPKEKLEVPWTYTWKAREVACEVYGSKHSPMRDSHKTFMETAMCLLLQTHWVNSPFDELAASSESIIANDSAVQILMGQDPDLGIFLTRETFKVETRTKTRGAIRAEYSEREGLWVPARLENWRDGSTLALEEFDYEPSARPGMRPALKSFWIAVGADQTFRHSFVTVKSCRPY